ncbi:hypothetical protein GGR52DRAFT_590025 [Hypoxylon sp. FL1284]|nr:hypothetical protein GGR52DRAFT_590025 [Hypoxylon sp. FL1284]
MSDKRDLTCLPLESPQERHVPVTSTLDFTPRSQARDASIAVLSSGSPEDLAWLREQIACGESLARQGPKTNGTEEVQLILREPSKRSVEKFHDACKLAETTLKYGNYGVMMYRLSRNLALDKAKAPRLPSLQLTGFSDMIRESAGFNGNTSSLTIASPVSEIGGWRDVPISLQDDAQEEAEHDIRDSLVETQDSDELEREWEIKEAQALTVTEILPSNVRAVQISSPSKQSPRSDPVNEGHLY